MDSVARTAERRGLRALYNTVNRKGAVNMTEKENWGRLIARAEKLTKTLDVKGLEELWAGANALEQEGPGPVVLRGLVMDRLEELNPEAFETWLEQAQDNDFSIFYTK